MSIGRTVEFLAPPHQTTLVAKLALTGPQAGQPASRQARIYPPDATRWGSTTLERANPLRLVRPWRNEPGFRGGEFQYSIFNIQCPSSWNHFSRQAARLRQGYGGQAKAQRGFLEGRPPCRPGDPNIQNATIHGLTPLQIRFEPQRAQRTQRIFGRVGRTLSGLSPRGGVSRAVGAGELNCSANHGLTLMDTDRKSGGYGENFNIQFSMSNIQCSSRLDRIHHRRTSALPGFSTNDQRRTTNDYGHQLFSISIAHATDDGGMMP